MTGSPDHRPYFELDVQKLAALYVLDGLNGFGPQKFRLLWEARIPPEDILYRPQDLPVPGKTGEKLKAELSEVVRTLKGDCTIRAERQIATAQKLGAKILTFGHPNYPPNLFSSNNPLPVLYTRGNVGVLLNRKMVACVGSRNIEHPYADLHRRFAEVACKQGFVVVSGFALGADSIGHKAAHASKGKTVCVMPSGLDRPFPPENRPLWTALLEDEGAVFVSEFAFGTSASSLTLRKRNKTIVALSLGVLVSQSSSSGGAMNAFRFALEQKKRVATFQDTGADATSGNAHIASATKVPTTTFNKANADDRGFERWLQQLASSI